MKRDYLKNVIWLLINFLMSLVKKESALDLMKEREKKDFLVEEECNYISHDL